MEKNMSIKSQGLKWGLILGLMSTIVSLLVNMFELYGNNTMVQIVSLILVLAALIFAFQEYKAAHDSYMNFGEGFGMSMLILLISGVFSSIFSFIYMKFIDSGMIDKIRDMQIAEMEGQGLSDEQINMTMDYAEFFLTPFMLSLTGLLAYLFFGAILSLILTAIFRNNRPVEL